MLSAGRIQGLFAIFGPGIFILITSLVKRSSDPWQLIPGALASVLIFLGALLISTHLRWAQLLLTGGVLGALGSSYEFLIGSPQGSLLALVLAGSAFHLIWSSSGEDLKSRYYRTRKQVVMRSASAVRASSFLSLGLWFFVVVAKIETSTPSYGAVAISYLITLGFALQWMRGERRRRRLNGLVVAGITGASLVCAALLWPNIHLSLSAVAIIPAAALIFVRERNAEAAKMTPTIEAFFFHPERGLVLAFLVLCILGTVALSIPAVSASGKAIRLVDAAFTAVSAVCVTGLIVLDTPVDFTFLGQGFILVMIQVGGLGIMTFSTATLVILGKRLSLRHEGTVAAMLGGEYRNKMVEALKRILLVTFVVEGVGAVVLSSLFISLGDPIGKGIWRGVFTSISAFCNAGFALQTDSLIGYQTHPVILHTIALLIILGGLSPLVVLAIPRVVARRAVGLQTKIVLAVSGALLVSGTLVIAAIEWRSALGHLDVWDKFHNAWFQSATTRTAGFNSIDFTALQSPTLLVTLFLMFVGGSPGGTAGGLKTTSFAVLVLAVASAFRGESRIHAFNRVIPHEIVYKAAALLTAGGVIGMTLLLSVLLTQPIVFEMAVFEVISALGTVGLSTGGTAKLDGIGKGLIMVCMFAGRVGPLSVFLFLANHRKRRRWKLPEEQVGLG